MSSIHSGEPYVSPYPSANLPNSGSFVQRPAGRVVGVLEEQFTEFAEIVLETAEPQDDLAVVGTEADLAQPPGCTTVRPMSFSSAM